MDIVRALVNNPDFSNEDQNIARNVLLFSERYALLDRLPKPVRWQVATMQAGDLERLRLIAQCGWDDKSPGNLLHSVRFPNAFDIKSVERIISIRRRINQVNFERTLILIAVNETGPFTIIDGNHRATAMMMAKRSGNFEETGSPVYIGISPRMSECQWYVRD